MHKKKRIITDNKETTSSISENNYKISLNESVIESNSRSISIILKKDGQLKQINIEEENNDIPNIE